MTSILVAALLMAASPTVTRAGRSRCHSSGPTISRRPSRPSTPGGPPRSIAASSTRPPRPSRKSAALKGERADGALYWSAYAHNKRGRRDDALQAIASLRSSYPKSRWLRDARALEVEIRQASGQTAVPDRNGDEDLKLMALGGLMNADPDRALPLVEQMLSSSQSDKVRDRALFVLAQSGSPKAREVLVRIARTGPDEDTQKRAIRYLGLFGGTGEPPGAGRHLQVEPERRRAQGRAARVHGRRRPRAAPGGGAHRDLARAQARSHSHDRRLGRARRVVAALSAGDVGRGERRDHQRAVCRRRQPNGSPSSRRRRPIHAFAARRSRSSG